MGLVQFARSIRQILANPHVHPPRAIGKHLVWQVRKALRLFPFEQALGGSRILADDPRCGVSALVHSQGLYDYDNMRFVHWLVQDGGVFFDVGANIGAYSLVVSEASRARVVAFEPHPRTHARLRANVALNARTNVDTHELALGVRDGAARLRETLTSSTHHLAGDGVAIACARGDTFVATHGVQPDVLKIDVEGFERDVLEGFGDALGAVTAVCVEINGLSDRRAGGGDGVHRVLVQHGFAGPWRCDFDARRLTRGQRADRDAIYVAAARLDALTARGFRVEPPAGAGA